MLEVQLFLESMEKAHADIAITAMTLKKVSGKGKKLWTCDLELRAVDPKKRGIPAYIYTRALQQAVSRFPDVEFTYITLGINGRTRQTQSRVALTVSSFKEGVLLAGHVRKKLPGVSLSTTFKQGSDGCQMTLELQSIHKTAGLVNPARRIKI